MLFQFKFSRPYCRKWPAKLTNHNAHTNSKRYNNVIYHPYDPFYVNDPSSVLTMFNIGKGNESDPNNESAEASSDSWSTIDQLLANT